MRIKQLRLSRNLTQEQLADKVNVKRTAVAMWERGDSFPRADKLPKIAEVLGCEIADLFERKETSAEVSDTCGKADA